jgi:hypothetical protein
VGDAGGSHEVLELPDVGQPEGSIRVVPNLWVSDHELEFLHARTQDELVAFTVDVRQDPLVPGPFRQVDLPSGLPTVDPTFERVRLAHPGRQLSDGGDTADRRGQFQRLDDAEPRLGRPNSLLVVTVDGRDHEFELVTKDAHGELSNLDVVLVGDWPTQ